MSNVKFTEEAQEERKKRLAHLREVRKDIHDLSDLKNTPEWAKLVRMLHKWSAFAKTEESIANAEHDREEIGAEVFSRRVLHARQKQADFDFVADILDKHEEQLKVVDAEIERVEQVFKEAKSTLE